METGNFQALQSGFEFADINKLGGVLHDVDEGFGIQVHAGAKKARCFCVPDAVKLGQGKSTKMF
jgi:hypothetical protein